MRVAACAMITGYVPYHSDVAVDIYWRLVVGPLTLPRTMTMLKSRRHESRERGLANHEVCQPTATGYLR